MFQHNAWHVSDTRSFQKTAVKSVLLKNQLLLGVNIEPQSYTAVCGLYAYGISTSKQTFLLDYYFYCEMTADDNLAQKSTSAQSWFMTVVEVPSVVTRPGFVVLWYSFSFSCVVYVQSWHGFPGHLISNSCGVLITLAEA